MINIKNGKSFTSVSKADLILTQVDPSRPARGFMVENATPGLPGATFIVRHVAGGFEASLWTLWDQSGLLGAPIVPAVEQHAIQDYLSDVVDIRPHLHSHEGSAALAIETLLQRHLAQALANHALGYEGLVCEKTTSLPNAPLTVSRESLTLRNGKGRTFIAENAVPGLPGASYEFEEHDEAVKVTGPAYCLGGPLRTVYLAWTPERTKPACLEDQAAAGIAFLLEDPAHAAAIEESHWVAAIEVSGRSYAKYDRLEHLGVQILRFCDVTRVTVYPLWHAFDVFQGASEAARAQLLEEVSGLCGVTGARFLTIYPSIGFSERAFKFGFAEAAKDAEATLTEKGAIRIG